MHRIPTLLCLASLLIGSTRAAEPVKSVTPTFQSMPSITGTARWDWWQARSTYVPGPKPFLLTTMSETGKATSHDFHDIFQSISWDMGKTWTAPSVIPSLKRERQTDGFEIAPGDLWPTYHAHSGKILATGKTFNFKDDKRFF